MVFFISSIKKGLISSHGRVLAQKHLGHSISTSMNVAPLTAVVSCVADNILKGRSNWSITNECP